MSAWRMGLFAAVCLAGAGVSAQQHEHGGAPAGLEQGAASAQKLGELGSYSRKVTTASKDAQAWFDQGLRLYYAFNHEEAFRSFAKAAAIDPKCASCFWGAALALGPNYNMPMLPTSAAAAWDAREKARALAASASPVEQALIGALSVRYAGPAPSSLEDQQQQNEAYAAQMRKVAQQFPADDDVQVLFAESMMDLNPWKLWGADGKPAPGTGELVSHLETVLARSPKHPGANHFYVHAVEASPHPEKALAAADRLGGMMPGAGHLVHMPAHIYQRTGRYEQASEANRRAIASDEKYAKTGNPSGMYLGMYAPHNMTFLAYSAAMEGRGREAIRAASMPDPKAFEQLPPEVLSMVEFYAAQPVVMMARFGRWNDVLATPVPNPKWPVSKGLWLHAQGLAHLATGNVGAAKKDLSALDQAIAAIPADAVTSMNKSRDVLAVGRGVLAGKLAEREGKTDEALATLRDAVTKEDALSYSEPPDWWYPVRHVLGDSLLAANRPAEAEQVYRADLVRHPKNGFSLFGLNRALAAEKKPEEAAQAHAEYVAAWSRADRPLTSSGLPELDSASRAARRPPPER